MTAAAFANHTSRLYALLHALPGQLAGTVPDPGGIATRVSEAVSTALLEMIRRAFWAKAGGGTGEDGVKWPPHAASTKRKRGNFALIGHQTGEMFRSIEARPEAGRIAVEATAGHATFFHRGTRRMPARPLWPQRLPRQWMDELLRVAARAVADEIRRATQ